MFAGSVCIYWYIHFDEAVMPIMYKCVFRFPFIPKCENNKSRS